MKTSVTTSSSFFSLSTFFMRLNALEYLAIFKSLNTLNNLNILKNLKSIPINGK